MMTASSVAPGENRRFNQLDSLRGLAALTVVFDHFIRIWPQTHAVKLMEKFPLKIFLDGHEAVILFFILSGFVLTIPFSRKLDIQYGRFITRRICRIWLPYLAALAVAFIGVSLFHGISASAMGWSDAWLRSIWSIPLNSSLVWQHFFLIGNYDWAQCNPVFWSLVYEMRISLIFPFVALAILRMPTKAAIAAAICLSLATKPLALLFSPVLFLNHDPDTRIGSQTFLTLHYLSFFILGSVCYKNLPAIQQKFSRLSSKSRFLLLMAAAFLYDAVFITHHVGRMISYTNRLFLNGQVEDWFTCAGSLLIVAISLTSRSSDRLLAHSAVHHVGRISYSLYLVHAPILFAMVRLWHRPSYPLIAFLVYMPIALGVAEVFNRLVENPSMVLGHRLTSRSRSDRRQPIAVTA